MSLLSTYRVLLAFSLTTSVAVAQNQRTSTEGQPEPSKSVEPTTTADAGATKNEDAAPGQAATSDDADSAAAEPATEQAPSSSGNGSTSPKPARAEALPAERTQSPAETPAPLLAPPTGTEQGPAPVVVEPEAPRPPDLELSFYTGAQWRTPGRNSVDYGTAFAWGVRAGVYPQPWLAARAYARFAKVPVDVKPGGYDTVRTQYPDTSFDQGNLDVFGLGFRLEPGPRLGRFRVFAILDTAWMRFVAPEPKTRGAQSVRSAERRGVGVDYKFGAGASFEPIEDWLSLGVDGTYGFITRQTGNAFDDVLQGIDDDGSIVHIAALPKFERTIEAFFSIGLIL